MSIQQGPGLSNLLRAAETGRLASIKKTVQITGSPFEDMAGLRPPVLGLPESPGIIRLRKLVGAAIPKPTPSTRGMFEVMARGAISPQLVDYIIANHQTIDHMKREARLMRPQLDRLPAVGFVTGHAALDLIQQARHFGDLTDSPEVQARLGGLVAKRLAGEIAPFDRKLQGAISELLLEGRLSEATLKPLGKRGRRKLQRLLSRDMPLITQLPARHAAMLQATAQGAVDAIRKDVDASAADIQRAVRDAMSPADQRSYDRAVKLGFNTEIEAAGQTAFDVPGAGRPRDPEDGPGLIDRAFEALPEIDKSGEVRFHREGRIEAQSSGSYDGALGSASYDARANVHASIDAHAKGSIRFDGERLEMAGEAGFRAELGAEATIKAQANLFGGAVQFDGTATAAVRAEAHANVAGSLSIGRDENGLLQVHAKGSVDVGASIEATGRVAGSANIAGLQVSGEAYGGVMIGVRAAASGEFGYKDGRVSAGFRIKLALGIGIDFGLRFSFKVPQWMRDFGGTIKNIGSTIKNGFQNVGKTVTDAVKSVGDAVGGAVKSVGRAVKKIFSGW